MTMVIETDGKGKKVYRIRNDKTNEIAFSSYRRKDAFKFMAELQKGKQENARVVAAK